MTLPRLTGTVFSVSPQAGAVGKSQSGTQSDVSDTNVPLNYDLCGFFFLLRSPLLFKWLRFLCCYGTWPFPGMDGALSTLWSVSRGDGVTSGGACDLSALNADSGEVTFDGASDWLPLDTDVKRTTSNGICLVLSGIRGDRFVWHVCLSNYQLIDFITHRMIKGPVIILSIKRSENKQSKVNSTYDRCITTITRHS